MSKFAVCLVAILCSSLVYGQSRGAIDENISAVFSDPTNHGSYSDNKNQEKTYDAFDWNLFQTLCNNNNDNVVISPFSLKFSMALLYEASAGTTSKQIESVLRFSAQKNETRRKFEDALKSLREVNENYILNFGSRIYLDESVKPNQKYGSIFNNTYQTQITSLNVNDVAKSANDANAWIENITKGRIRNLVTEEDLLDAVIVMLNAIYFEGTWEHQFNKSLTKNDVFYVSSNKAISTSYMRQTESFQFYSAQPLDAKILRLPYKGSKYAMYIVLPNSINGLPNLISSLSANQIQRAVNKAEYKSINLKMPRFQIEYLTKFVPILQEMNIHELFDNSASLPGFARGKGLAKKLMVSNILQKSGIDVNELGSTAYSATEVTLVNKFGSDDETEDFEVNKPFLFFIEDETSKQILFMGKIEDLQGNLSGSSDKKPGSLPPRPIPSSAAAAPPPPGTIYNPNPVYRPTNQDR